MVWTCHEERLGVCRKKGDGNGVIRKEENREAKEKISRCNEEEHEEFGANEKDIKNSIRFGTPDKRESPKEEEEEINVVFVYVSR